MRLVLMYFGEFSVTTELESPSLRESASKVDVNKYGLKCVRQKFHEVLYISNLSSGHTQESLQYKLKVNILVTSHMPPRMQEYEI